MSTVLGGARTATMDAAAAVTAAKKQVTALAAAPSRSASTGADAPEAAFCSDNPDLCTGGVPDKKSDRAEYQNDPRSNAEINGGQRGGVNPGPPSEAVQRQRIADGLAAQGGGYAPGSAEYRTCTKNPVAAICGG